MRVIYLVLVSLMVFASCVSPRKVEDLEKRLKAISDAKENCEENLSIREEQLERAEENEEEAEEEAKLLEKENDGLKQDTLIMGRNYRRLKLANKDLNETLEKQVKVNKQLTEQSEQKNKQLYQELIALQRELEDKEEKLNERNKNLNDLQKDLVEREAKVDELQSAINDRDSMMSALKNRITKALLDYEDKGISVNIKGDKVYVSLEEQILFGSGKYELDKKGETAILDLATVLKSNPDLSILVEGHTDNVPIKTSCISDNYDLSVLRGAEIARLLTNKGNVDPKRIIAAGRGEYLPIASNETKEGRKANRRIEIILTPDLDKLFKLINE